MRVATRVEYFEKDDKTFIFTKTGIHCVRIVVCIYILNTHTVWVKYIDYIVIYSVKTAVEWNEIETTTVLFNILSLKQWSLQIFTIYDMIWYLSIIIHFEVMCVYIKVLQKYGRASHTTKIRGYNNKILKTNIFVAWL